MKTKSSNRIGFRNKDADRIAEALRREFDQDKRVALCHEFHALVHELHTLQMRGVEGVLRRMAADDRQRVIKGLEALVDAASEAAKP